MPRALVVKAASDSKPNVYWTNATASKNRLPRVAATPAACRRYSTTTSGSSEYGATLQVAAQAKYNDH